MVEKSNYKSLTCVPKVGVAFGLSSVYNFVGEKTPEVGDLLTGSPWVGQHFLDPIFRYNRLLDRTKVLYYHRL